MLSIEISGKGTTRHIQRRGTISTHGTLLLAERVHRNWQERSGMKSWPIRVLKRGRRGEHILLGTYGRYRPGSPNRSLTPLSISSLTLPSPPSFSPSSSSAPYLLPSLPRPALPWALTATVICVETRRSIASSSLPGILFQLRTTPSDPTSDEPHVCHSRRPA